jgi:HEAT repeat protein
MEALTVLADDGAPLQARIEAVRAVSQGGGEQAIDALAALVGVSSEELLTEVGRALRKLGAADLMQRRLLAAAEPVERRRLAAVVLRVLGEPTSAGALVLGLEDPEATVRAACAHALVVVRTPEAEPALIAALGDGSAEVRYYAVLALEALGTEAGRKGLAAHRPHEQDPLVQDDLARILDR